MSTCSRCGASFGCAMVDGGAGPCWCTELPPAVPVPEAGGSAAQAACWCPACLRAHIAQQSRPDDGAPPADKPAADNPV